MSSSSGESEAALVRGTSKDPPSITLTGGMWGSGRAADPAGWLPMVATGSAFFMIVLDTSIVNLALARIGAEFGAGLSTLQWLVDGYAGSSLLGAGAFGDRFGAERVFMCGLSVFTLASALCGLAPGIGTLQVSRVLQGMGAALLLPNSLLR